MNHLTASVVHRETSMDLAAGCYEIPAYFKPHKSASRLLVLLPGAVDRTSYDVVFQRASWANDFESHVLALADPTILATPSMRLGWFQGTDAQPMFGELAHWIREFSTVLDINPAHVLIYGSSAGGFAGLKLAELLTQPRVVAINPQIYLDRYAPEHYHQMLLVSYAGLTRDLVEATHYAHLSVSPLVLDRTASTCIVLNTFDRLHSRSHVQPLMAHRSLKPEQLATTALEDLEGFHTLLYTDISRGHAPPDRETETQLIQAALRF